MRESTKKLLLRVQEPGRILGLMTAPYEEAILDLAACLQASELREKRAEHEAAVLRTELQSVKDALRHAEQVTENDRAALRSLQGDHNLLCEQGKALTGQVQDAKAKIVQLQGVIDGMRVPIICDFQLKARESGFNCLHKKPVTQGGLLGDFGAIGSVELKSRRSDIWLHFVDLLAPIHQGPEVGLAKRADCLAAEYEQRFGPCA